MDGPATSAEAWPGDGRPAPQARSRYEPVWWALAFAAVTTAGLGLLAWGLLIMHALIYGAVAGIGPETITAPGGARYFLGFTVAVVVNLVTAAGLASTAGRTPGRTWPPVLQGLAAALLAAVAAGCALLITVGINPVDFAVALQLVRGGARGGRAVQARKKLSVTPAPRPVSTGARHPN